MTEREHIENKKRLADIILNNKDSVCIGGNTYLIGALRYYTKWKISDLITKMELADESIVTLIEAMGKNIPVMAEIISLAILNDRACIEDEEKLSSLKYKIMDSSDGMEWGDALNIVFSKLDTGFFFGLTEMIKELNSMNSKGGYRKRMAQMSKQESTYQPIQNLVK